MGSPGVQAEFSGSGTNASLGPFSGDIQRVSAPTATPNYLSNSLTTSGRKFVLIVGGGIAVKDAYIGEGGTYLSYTEGGGTANAKVWVAQGGVFGISVCPGGAYALVGFGPDANNDTGIPMTPSPQSSATGTLHVKMYVRLP